MDDCRTLDVVKWDVAGSVVAYASLLSVLVAAPKLAQRVAEVGGLYHCLAVVVTVSK